MNFLGTAPDQRTLGDTILHIEHKETVMNLDKRAFGLAMGILMSGCIFLATLFAMYKGAGGHLVMLKRFYIGYNMTYLGAVIGAVWAFVDGFLCGWIFAWLYNRFAQSES